MLRPLLIWALCWPCFASIINKDRLKTCHPKLIKIVEEVAKYQDVIVLECHRGKKRQNKLYKEKKTLLKYPRSKHNKNPSQAVDLVPHPINWKDIQRLREFANFVKGVSIGMGIEILNGGLDWEYFSDYPHYQLKE